MYQDDSCTTHVRQAVLYSFFCASHHWHRLTATRRACRHRQYYARQDRTSEPKARHLKKKSVATAQAQHAKAPRTQARLTLTAHDTPCSSPATAHR